MYAPGHGLRQHELGGQMQVLGMCVAALSADGARSVEIEAIDDVRQRITAGYLANDLKLCKLSKYCIW